MYLKTFATICLIASPAWADVGIHFIEGAPKDRFVLTNLSDCTLEEQTIVLDLTPSAGGLIFDVTGLGAGVEVFQPFELIAGAGNLVNVPEVSDGDRVISLSVRQLAPSDEIAFTIDVDDTGGAREITVNSSEMSGATLQVGNGKPGVFNAENRAVASVADCAS
jgi:hypothetical protein